MNKTYLVDITIPVVITLEVDAEDEDTALEKAETVAINEMEKLSHQSIIDDNFGVVFHVDGCQADSEIVGQN